MCGKSFNLLHTRRLTLSSLVRCLLRRLAAAVCLALWAIPLHAQTCDLQIATLTTKFASYGNTISAAERTEFNGLLAVLRADASCDGGYADLMVKLDALITAHTPTPPVTPPPTTGCTQAVTPTTASVPATGATADVQVVSTPTGPTCQWSTSSPVPWATISPGVGDNSRAATYTVQPNTATTPRSVVVVVGSATLTLTQAAAGSVPPPVTPPPTAANVNVLDDFAASTIRVVQPNQTDVRQRFLWSLYSVQGVTLDLVTVDGLRALRTVYPGGSNWQTALHTYTENAPGFGNGWQYAKAFTMKPWTNNTYNRLRFRIKVPPGIAARPNGASTFEFGTFVRTSTAPLTDQESNNGHYYHMFNLKTTGAWETVIVDMHPNAQRQSTNECSAPSGNGECGVLAHPTGEAGFNYFDVMTHFYFDFPYVTNSSAGFPVPATFYIAGVEFYQETAVENEDQVYSLHASITPAGAVSLGWQHKKTEAISHEVRYAWSDIHASGWASAIPLATVAALNTGGYNGMDWNGTVPIAGHAGGMLYLAIKPVGATLFTQIAVPVP